MTRLISTYIWIFDCLMLHLKYGGATCPAYTTDFLYLPRRLSSNYAGTNDEPPIIDSLFDETSWHRYPNGTISNWCPEVNKCGTIYPIWLQYDQLPTVGSQITATACLRNDNVCCSKNKTVFIRACQETTEIFYIYQLKILQDSGWIGYCIDLDCPNGLVLNQGNCSIPTATKNVLTTNTSLLAITTYSPTTIKESLILTSTVNSTQVKKTTLSEERDSELPVYQLTMNSDKLIILILVPLMACAVVIVTAVAIVWKVKKIRKARIYRENEGCGYEEPPRPPSPPPYPGQETPPPLPPAYRPQEIPPPSLPVYRPQEISPTREGDYLDYIPTGSSDLYFAGTLPDPGEGYRNYEETQTNVYDILLTQDDGNGPIAGNGIINDRDVGETTTTQPTAGPSPIYDPLRKGPGI